jgi:hypothetical protein
MGWIMQENNERVEGKVVNDESQEKTWIMKGRSVIVKG